MTRDEFREAVFARDNHRCVVCKGFAVDAHHLLERRLWPDGGYHLDNGVSLCEFHHKAAEATLLSVEGLRELAGVKKIVPPHLEMDERYDKWGNIFLANGLRAPGELFWDESVQKALTPVLLNQFVRYMKYPRTLHLPWSEGQTEDDRTLTEDPFLDQDVVVTEKLDGENTTFYHDHIHARSIDSKSHPSRSWVKNLHAKIAHEIPPGWRICGENLQAQHSIAYRDLPGFFLVFSIWDGQECLSWDDTLLWAEYFDLPVVPVIFRGLWEPIQPRYGPENYVPRYSQEAEGYVVRLSCAFTYREYRQSVAKYVRANHVNESTQHWFARQIVENGLANKPSYYPTTEKPL